MLAVNTVAAIGTAVGGGLVEAYRALTPWAFPAAGGAFAITLAAAVGLAIGCCCGLGWGLLLGSAAPRAVRQLARAGGALVAAAAVAPQEVVLHRASLPRPVRLPAFLAEEA